MKPAVVLNIQDKKNDDPIVFRDLWIAEYDAIAKWNLSKEDICDVLKKRVTRACSLYIERMQPKGSGSATGGHDEAYYEWWDELIKEEDDSLDGDFPLGNTKDAEFANQFFNMQELAEIQCGIFHLIRVERDNGHDSDVLVRKGFIAELCEDWQEAVRCYEGVSASKIIQKRECECRRKMTEEGERCYNKAQEYMASGQWSEVYGPLSRAVDMEHSDAMVDMALACVYGQFGVRKCISEALELLRKAAMKNSARACFELVELHDNGIGEIEGKEAKQMCEKAASLGHKKAAVRLESEFDLRTTAEILAEQAERGNKEAMWMLYLHMLEKKDDETAVYWYRQALEAGQVDALMHAAKIYLQKNGECYDKRLGMSCLKDAAEQGCVRAMIALGELELKEEDENFWNAAMKIAERKPDLMEKMRHQRQFTWYERAAEAGDGNAMNALCVSYHFGYPVRRDDRQAFLWAEKAVKMGDEVAMYQVAYFYENGFGVERDLDAAMNLYMESAEKGVVSSMMRLYQIYSEGLEHIKADKEKAARYLWMSGIGHS